MDCTTWGSGWFFGVVLIPSVDRGFLEVSLVHGDSWKCLLWMGIPGSVKGGSCGWGFLEVLRVDFFPALRSEI